MKICTYNSFINFSGANFLSGLCAVYLLSWNFLQNTSPPLLTLLQVNASSWSWWLLCPPCFVPQTYPAGISHKVAAACYPRLPPLRNCNTHRQHTQVLMSQDEHAPSLSRHSSEPKALLRRTAIELCFFHLFLPETDFSFSPFIIFLPQ